MSRHFIRTILLVTTSLALTACGGGGGTHLASTPTPQAQPAPPPPPPPPPTTLRTVQIFPSVTTNTEFGAVGIETGPGGTLTTTGFAVRYDAASNVYVIDLPSSAPGAFKEYSSNTPNDRYWGGTLESLSQPGTHARDIYVLKPSATNSEIALTYTSYAAYDVHTGSPTRGFVAFGIPTAAGSVPTTGTATYVANVYGTNNTPLYLVGGTAQLSFNFGAGSLSGFMEASVTDGWNAGISLGRYDFVNTVYSSGSTNFSGGLSNGLATGTGSFSGIFTGPSAQELMARWQASYIDPLSKTQSTMFGVWVGKH